MVRIRLSRTGRKNLPSYKIVVAPGEDKRESKVLEYIGHYSPITKELKIVAERAKYWMSVGAQPSDTVKYLLSKEGIIEKPAKREFKKKPGKKATERAPKEETKEAA